MTPPGAGARCSATLRALLAAAVMACAAAPLHAAEGTSIAGPIGGTDIRSALLPPPGLYVSGVAISLIKKSR